MWSQCPTVKSVDTDMLEYLLDCYDNVVVEERRAPKVSSATSKSSEFQIDRGPQTIFPLPSGMVHKIAHQW